MPQTQPAVQVETVVRIERELKEARKVAAKALREARKSRHVTLRKAARGIRLSPAALSQLERGATWESKTALKVVRFLGRVDQVA